MNRVNEILLEALKLEEGHIRRTQHILKVHSLVKSFGERLNLDMKSLELVEIASILHDSGIKICKDKNIEPTLENQLTELKEIFESLVEKYNFSLEEKKRVWFLIENHHNYEDINDLAHQILIEADLIINIFEKNKEGIEKYRNYFRTGIGKEMFKIFFS